MLNNEKKVFFEKALRVSILILYLFFRNEISYFFSVLKELKEHKLRQKGTNHKFTYLDDLIHLKNALLHGWVIDDLYDRTFKCKVFNIRKFKKIIEYKSII